MRRFIAIGLVIVTISAANVVAAQNNAHLHFSFVNRRPTRDDEERTGIVAKEQRIKNAMDELDATVVAEEEAKIRLARVPERLGRHINAEEYGAAVVTYVKRQRERAAAEERLKMLVGRADGITQPNKK